MTHTRGLSLNKIDVQSQIKISLLAHRFKKLNAYSWLSVNIDNKWLNTKCLYSIKISVNS